MSEQDTPGDVDAWPVWHVNDVTAFVKQHEQDVRDLAAVTTHAYWPPRIMTGIDEPKPGQLDFRYRAPEPEPWQREFESLTTRHIQKFAAKAREQMEEALERALRNSAHFEVHIYSWSSYPGDHSVKFHQAVEITVRGEGGPRMIHHPYGEEPFRDERRD